MKRTIEYSFEIKDTLLLYGIGEIERIRKELKNIIELSGFAINELDDPKKGIVQKILKDGVELGEITYKGVSIYNEHSDGLLALLSSYNPNKK
ncbi:MAG: hypothetical protein ACOYT4_04440 [Nanoarchaeota archaeon]